jgi:hypothetical protein
VDFEGIFGPGIGNDAVFGGAIIDWYRVGGAGKRLMAGEQLRRMLSRETALVREPGTSAKRKEMWSEEPSFERSCRERPESSKKRNFRGRTKYSVSIP